MADRETARGEAAEEARAALVELAAELLRLVAGGGKVHSLAILAGTFADAANAYRDVAKVGLMEDEIRKWLRDGLPDYWSDTDLPMSARYERRSLVQSSLRIAASRLLGQRTQESNADNALAVALRARDDRVRARHG